MTKLRDQATNGLRIGNERRMRGAAENLETRMRQMPCQMLAGRERRNAIAVAVYHQRRLHAWD
jgi:ABC-type ATPase involved in cell division